jgi:two-component system, LuxR family, response regulator FixJ
MRLGTPMKQAEISLEVIQGAAQHGSLIMSETCAVPVIAIVDDDKSVRESLAEFMESVGYEVALFSSAEEFLGSTRRCGDLRCMILDVRLPGMSGLELFSQLTASCRSLPTILITAHVDATVAAWATKPGVVSVLYKPFQPSALLKAVQSALTRSRP